MFVVQKKEKSAMIIEMKGFWGYAIIGFLGLCDHWFFGVMRSSGFWG